MVVSIGIDLGNLNVHNILCRHHWRSNTDKQIIIDKNAASWSSTHLNRHIKFFGVSLFNRKLINRVIINRTLFNRKKFNRQKINRNLFDRKVFNRILINRLVI